MTVRNEFLGEIIFDKTAKGVYRWAADTSAQGEEDLWIRLKLKFDDLIEDIVKLLEPLVNSTADIIMEVLQNNYHGKKYLKKINKTCEGLTITFFDIL